MQNNKIGSGLHNLGNTCFFNAVMQVILYTPSLVQYFRNNSHSSSCKKPDWCIFCAIERLWHSSKKTRVVTPNDIVSHLKNSVYKKFRLGRQQDSHEYLRYLVEGMQEAQTGKLGKDRQKNEETIMKTKTYHTFGGKLRTFVLCLNCNHKSLTSQRYYDLSIQCQRSNTLLQGLQNYFKIDDLTGSNKYKCDSCKQLSNAKKGFKIISIPSVVTFQFKRFTNNLRKIGKLIQYPKIINLNPYMEKHHQNELDGKLQLYGVIVHSGSSAGSGHYYAFVKNGSEWFEMNDGTVSRCKQDRVLMQQAYLLFYRRLREERPPQVISQVHEKQQIITNIKDNNNNIVKVTHERSQTAQKPQNKQQNKRKKSFQKRPRKQSEQQLQQTKRKLSMDIQNLKQQARQQQNIKLAQKTNKNKEDAHRQENKIQINGKKINGVNFGELIVNKKGKNDVKNGTKLSQKINNNMDTQQNADEYDEEEIQIPKLTKRKSKQQALSQLSIMQMLLSYAEKISTLQSKIPKNSHRVLRSVNNLRKFQILSKRRKLNG